MSKGNGSDPLRSTYRPDIDGLRAVAILSVVAFHAFPDRFPGGYVGVDIFFVISGYLISSIILLGLARGSFDFWDFYARRIRRIFPALIVVLSVSYIYGWFNWFPKDYAQLGGHIAAGAGFASNFILWSESGYFDLDAIRKPLLHLWSLGIEEQFYLVRPLVLWLAWGKRKRVPGMILSVLAASFALNLALVGSDKVAAFYAPWTRFWELLIGATLAYFSIHTPVDIRLALQRVENACAGLPHMRRTNLGRKSGNVLCNMVACAGAVLIALGLFVITRESLFPGWCALLPTVGAALLLCAGGEAWVNKTVLAHKGMVFVGLISYPLYLWHWPLLSVVWCSQAKFSRVSFAGLRIAVVLVSGMLAYVTYRYIEKPIRFGKHKKHHAVPLMLSVVLVGGMGLAVYAGKGFPSRYPEQVLKIAEFTYDYAADYRYSVCFLRPEQDASMFGDCTSGGGGERLIFLWGDSHAAHLYPGLVEKKGKTHRVAQYTASACPPVLGKKVPSRPFCESINSFVLQKIASDVPYEVILSASWRLDEMDGENSALLKNTIQELRAIGVPIIRLVGPGPIFTDAPQKTLAMSALENGQSIPTRIMIDNAWFDLDAKMAAFAEEQAIAYTSILNAMCNGDGCLVRGETVEDLYFWDLGHLTKAGSVYLSAHFPE